MKSRKLKVVGVRTFKKTFGTTDYSIFDCLTENQEPIQCAVAYSLLRDRGVNIDLLDSFVDSTIIVNDDVNIKTGLLTPADQRIQQILDGTLINERTGKPSQVVLVNGANGTVIKSDIYLAETKDLASSTNAKVHILNENQRKLDGAKRLAERLKSQKAVATPVAETEAELVEEEPEF